jgi:hypothetical protein
LGIIYTKADEHKVIAMTKINIFNTLKKLKPQYQQDGIILLGLFGS